MYLAILFYDFVLTFGREVNSFWSKKPTGASALFFFIRYVTLAYEVLDVVSSVFTLSDQVCYPSSLEGLPELTPSSQRCDCRVAFSDGLTQRILNVLALLQL